MKLSRELGQVQTGRTLYVLDEPTTGLHFEDIHKLLAVLFRLVDAGNTVVVIEHNLDVVKCADWVIDLGPRGRRARRVPHRRGDARAGRPEDVHGHGPLSGAPAGGRPSQDGCPASPLDPSLIARTARRTGIAAPK